MSEKFDKEYQQAHGELPKRHSPEAMSEVTTERLAELIRGRWTGPDMDADYHDTTAALRELASLREGAQDANLREALTEATALLQEFYQWDNHGDLTKAAIRLRARTGVFLHGHPPGDAALSDIGAGK